MTEQAPHTNSEPQTPDEVSPQAALAQADLASARARELLTEFGVAHNLEQQQRIAKDASELMSRAGNLRYSAWTRDPSLRPDGWKPKPE